MITWLSTGVMVFSTCSSGRPDWDLDNGSVERCEDRNTDPLLAERTDERVLAAVAVVGLRSAAPVEDAGARIEVDEVAEVEVSDGIPACG